MSEIPDKIRLVLWPLLKLELILVPAYGGLLWLALLVFPTFDPPEGLWRWVLLGVTALVAIMQVLEPRLRLLYPGRPRRTPNKFDWRLYLFMVALPTLWGLLYCVHGYLVTQTNPVVEVQRLNPEAPLPQARYYVMGEPWADRRRAGLAATINDSKKKDLKLFALFVSCPLYDTPADTATGHVRLWLGQRFSASVSAAMPSDSIQTAYQRFLAASENQFRTGPPPHFFGYFEPIEFDEDRIGLAKATKHSMRYVPGAAEPLLVQASSVPFAERSAAAAAGFRFWLLWGNGVFALMLACTALLPNAAGRLAASQAKPNDTWWPTMMRFLRPRPGYCFTPCLAALLVLAYLMPAAVGTHGFDLNVSQLVRWGAASEAAIRDGEWWRLLTGTLLHDGPLALCANVVALGFAGYVVEPATGNRRLAMVYGLCALAGSLAQAWWQPESLNLGASGAVLGLCAFGIVVGRRLRQPDDLLANFIALGVFFGVLNLVAGYFSPGTDNAAHLGGLATGALLGLALAPQLRREASAAMG